MARKNDNAGGRIGGVSLASFLQMLEQETKTCTLVVEADGREGRLFLVEGTLIDADCEGVVGQEAVYKLLSWEDPSFRITEVEDRLQRITLPLAHILLQAATMLDEAQDEEEQDGDSGGRKTTSDPFSSPAVQNNPSLRRLLETIIAIPEVRHYYLLNRQGKVVVQSSQNKKMADLITYSVVSGIQMRKALQVKGPHRIQLDLDNGDMLLIFPGAGMIICLQLDGDASVSKVAATLRPALLQQATAPKDE